MVYFWVDFIHGAWWNISLWIMNLDSFEIWNNPGVILAIGGCNSLCLTSLMCSALRYGPLWPQYPYDPNSLLGSGNERVMMKKGSLDPVLHYMLQVKNWKFKQYSEQHWRLEYYTALCFPSLSGMRGNLLISIFDTPLDLQNCTTFLSRFPPPASPSLAFFARANTHCLSAALNLPFPLYL